MKCIAASAIVALAGLAQSSFAAPTQTASSAPAATTTSAQSYFLRIATSTSNSTLDGWYAYIDPSGSPEGGDSVPVQFTHNVYMGTAFQLIENAAAGTLLTGYREGWVAGSSGAEGGAYGGAVFQAPQSYYLGTKGAGPVIDAVINSKTAATQLMDTLADGTVRNVAQACSDIGINLPDNTLPVLVVGEKLFDGCNELELILTPYS